MRSERERRISELARKLQAGGLDFEDERDITEEYHSLINAEVSESKDSVVQSVDREAAIARERVITERLQNDRDLNWRYAEREELERELLALHKALAETAPLTSPNEPSEEAQAKWRDMTLNEELPLEQRQYASEQLQRLWGFNGDPQ